MDRFERIFILHQILSHRKHPTSSVALAERMECSVITIKRTIELMRNLLNAPIVYSRKQSGYYYQKNNNAIQFELPGLWFNSNEVFALLSMESMLRNLEPGFLAQELSPVRKQLGRLLSKLSTEAFDFRRIRVLGIGQRARAALPFQKVAAAMFNQKRIMIEYHARGSDKKTQRVVSPQRLVHYRYNWYLDAWCHTRDALRVFSLERLKVLQVLKKQAKPVSVEALEEAFSQAYGIFSGKPTNRAVLAFSAERARWVADEYWHPEQKLTELDNGGCELSFPYADDTELIQDILKHGFHVEVLSPAQLRRKVAEHIRQAQKLYD